MNPNIQSPEPDPIPQAIIEDVNAQYWRICWEPNAAGIILFAPSLVLKPSFSARFPNIVRVWEALKIEERQEVHRIERNAAALARELNDYSSGRARAECAIVCDQTLLPGVRQHWGHVQQCETHPSNQGSFSVCKGCRVAHHMQASRDFDRPLVMARGARVAVCEKCAIEIIKAYGVGYRICECDTVWSCFRCREEKLETLAKARREADVGDRCVFHREEEACLVAYVDYCVYCRGARIYSPPN